MSRRIDQSGREAQRALLHGLRHQSLHFFQFRWSWVAIHIAQDGLTHLRAVKALGTTATLRTGMAFNYGLL